MKPEEPDKMVAFKNWIAEKAELRKTPGFCIKCARPNPDPVRKTCARCLDRQRVYRRRILAERNVFKMAEYKRLLKRVESLEQAVARLETSNRRFFGRERTRRWRKKINDAKDPDGFTALYGHREDTVDCQPSFDELKQISHVYDKET